MLCRAVSLLSVRAAWLRRQPVTAAATLIRRRPEARLVDARGIARMARRIPPARPDGYSTSDGEDDASGDDEILERAAGADGEEEEEDVEWEGLTVDFGKGTIEEYDHGDDEYDEQEGEK